MSDPLGEPITRTRRRRLSSGRGYCGQLGAPRSKFQIGLLRLKGGGLYSRIELLRSHLFF
jgi:hypothetical protein